MEKEIVMEDEKTVFNNLNKELSKRIPKDVIVFLKTVKDMPAFMPLGIAGPLKELGITDPTVALDFVQKILSGNCSTAGSAACAIIMGINAGVGTVLVGELLSNYVNDFATRSKKFGNGNNGTNNNQCVPK